MALVLVRVPESDAIEWEPWLTTALGEQARALDLGYDGGESDGRFEVFDFEGDPALVEQAVVTALRQHGVRRRTKRTGHTVSIAGVADDRWLLPLSPKDHPYEDAMHRVAREVSADPELREWFSGTGRTTIRFHESHEPGRPALFPGPGYEEDGELYLMHFTDLSIVDDAPTKAEAERAARDHIQDVLRAVAGHLGHPLP